MIVVFLDSLEKYNENMVDIHIFMMQMRLAAKLEEIYYFNVNLKTD